jgi:hypothetical protein
VSGTADIEKAEAALAASKATVARLDEAERILKEHGFRLDDFEDQGGVLTLAKFTPDAGVPSMVERLMREFTVKRPQEVSERRAKCLKARGLL